MISGCAGMNHAERGTLIGGGLGAVTGAIIGHQSGHGELGAVLGAGAGAIAGNLVGDAEDAREQRDAALNQLAYEQAMRSSQPPLTNADLIYMSQNGLSDDVIINAVRARGGQFNLDPSSLVALKQSGVSDRVIANIQTVGTSVPRRGPVMHVVHEPPPVVVVHPGCYHPPPPAVRASIHFGSHHHRHRHHH